MKEIILICISIFILVLVLYHVVSHQEGMQSHPYVLSNTTVETGPDFLEKKTYMEDTCGNFMSSDYNSVIHSISKFFQPVLSPKPLTASDCTPYQTFTQDPNTGIASCANICQDTQQYFDTTGKTCRYCPIGYTNDGNNNCVPLETCPYGLKYVDHTKNCVSCPVGQKYDDTINCVDICLDYESYQPDGTCKLKCPSRLQYYDKTTQSCLSCPAGYLEDDHNNCVPAPTCPPGQIPDVNQTCVTQCTQSWTRYDVTSNTCVPRCYDGQQLVNNQCVDCPDGTMSDGNNNCVPLPTTPPPTCNPGYNYDAVQKKCVSDCPTGYKNNLFNNLQCDPMCFGYEYYSNGTCLTCPDGQVSDGKNGCMAAPTPAPTPLICSEGYQPTTDTATGKQTCQSICPPNRINNKLNPKVCDLICQDPNEIVNTTTKQCTPCDSNSTPNDEHTQCLTIPPTSGTPVFVLSGNNAPLSSQYNAASWIWNVSYAATAAVPNQYIWFYKNFVYKGNAMLGQVYALVMDVGALYLNGKSVGSIGSSWGASGNGTILPITLVYGLNTIAIAAYATGGPGGLIAAVFDGNGTALTQTDQTWTFQCSQSFAGNDITQCDNSQPVISSMVANATSPTQITVTVQVVASTVNSVTIVNNTNGQQSGSLQPNGSGQCSIQFNGLSPSTQYNFSAIAYNSQSQSTSQQTASTPNTPPPPPPPPTPAATIPPVIATTPPPWKSSRIGGTGGSQFEDWCPNDSYVTGLQGRGGAWVDQTGASCSDGSSTPARGGSGGSQSSVKCSSGGMQGVTVRWGNSQSCGQDWYTGVGSLTPICMDGASNDAIGGAGCNTGSNSETLYCPAGMRVAGISGAAGVYNDSFGILCKAIPSS
jgi:hypothetical protein